MATEKLRAELELITKNAEKDLARLDRSLAGVEKRVKSIGGRGGRSLKPLGDGLSAATANASEFEKSMAAANARVIAFGASAGLIFQVQKALKETVRATVEVEKALADINVVLGAGAKDLEKFGNRLFKVAAQTGQSFKTIAVGATELARQGLGTEKTLKRLNDAMILSRLTGMGAEEAVSSLTAAVNSFAKAGITSAQVVNKMAKVDQAFAVSSDDLAKAISRVGSSAVDAGVSMDELLAITTAVQQRTARGGAVIGNAFKTIFTRIGRTDVQKKLQAIGVATTDMATGAMLPATKVLQNLSEKFKVLSQVQQNQIAESVAGVFQVNILRAALGDLSSKYGVYTRAIKESSTATDEAYQKNALLNQTLDALVNKTLANLTKAGASIGGATLKPAIENVLGFVNSTIEAFGEGGRFEKFGQGIGKDIMKGMGDFIAGPGLALVVYGVGRLLVNFGGFAKEALGGILELNKNVALRKNIEASVTAELSRQPAIIKQIQNGELSAAAAARDMLAAMKASNVEATKLAVTSRAIASSMMAAPGGMRGMRGAGRADGFVPNFANPNAERAAAAAGGYKAGGIRTMSIPGQGAVMYNSAETVKQFPGMKQPAIMPPQGSLAGSNYKKAFGAAHGFDPYAAGGFVPNFANMTLVTMLKKGRASASIGPVEKGQQVEVSNPQIQSLVNTGFIADPRKPKKTKRKLKPLVFDAQHQLGILGLDGLSGDKISTSTAAGNIKEFRKAGLTERQLQTPIRFENLSVRNLSSIKGTKGGAFKQEFSDKVSKEMLSPVARMAKFIYGKALGNDFNVSVKKLEKEFFGKQTQLLPTSAEGQIFEAAINLGLLTNRKNNEATFNQSIEASTKPFDFEEVGTAKPPFKEIFNFKDTLLYADAKRTADTNQVRTLIKKAYNRGVPGLPQPSMLKGGKAAGLIPNFSPLGDAITRERAAGVPASAIRVGSSAALKSSGNPGGLGVYNTIHEPAGLGQGISRSRRMGINPKSHGIPNFQTGFGLSADQIRILNEAKTSGLGYRSSHGRAFTPSYSTMKAGLVGSPTDAMRAALGGSESSKVVKTFSDSTKVHKESVDKFSDASGKFAGAAMALSTIAMMGGPAISRATGLDEQGFQSAMMAMFGAQMLQSFVPKVSMGAKGKSAMNLGQAFKGGYGGVVAGKGMMGPMKPSAAKVGFGDKLIRGAKAAGASAIGLSDLEGAVGKGKKGLGARALSLGKFGLKGAAKIAASPITLALAAFGGYQAFKTTPEEKEAMEAQEELARLQEKDFRPALGEVGTKVSSLAGGFNMLSGARKSQAFREISGALYGEDIRGKATDEQFAPIERDYKEFVKSFSKGGDAVQKAGDKLQETMAKVAEELGKVDTKAKQIERKEFYSKLTRPTERPERVNIAGPTAKSAQAVAKRIFEESGGIVELRKRILEQSKKTGKSPSELVQRNTNLLDFVGLNEIKAFKSTVAQFAEVGMDKEFKQFFAKEILRLIKPKNLGTALDLEKMAADSFAAMKPVDASKERSKMFQAKLDVEDSKTRISIIERDSRLSSAKEAAERRYTDALDYSSRDLYTDANVGFREAKIRAKEELDKQTKIIAEENLQLLLNRKANVSGTRVKIREQFVDAETARKMEARFNMLIAESGRPGFDIDERINKLRKGADVTGGRSDTNEVEISKILLDYLETLKQQNQTGKKNAVILDTANKTHENSIDVAKKDLATKKRLIDAQFEYSRVLEQMTQAGAARLAAEKAGFAQTDLDAGRLTGDQFRARMQEARARHRDRYGMTGRGSFAGFGTITREALTYGPRSATEEFEAGIADMALSVRDSLKDAIKNIASGAESFEDGMFRIFAALADKIADQGINMGVNAITGSLFGRRHGGKIPGYNQGGVVSGGSGVRDDVLTMMQGGEYVIKKSSAQKIGYGTLNAINGYANGGKARVSLAKEFLFTGDDPKRPTGGKYNVSRNLSTAAMFRDDDPQTANMFGREQTLTSYLEYRRKEQERRDKVLDDIKKQKRARLMNAYMSAGLRIGAGFIGGNFGPQGSGTAAVEGGTGSGALTINPAKVGSNVPEFPMARGGSPALLMGGEYVMSPRTTAKYGTGFMAELNRGKVPGYAQGGMVGGGGGGAAGGITTNNVNLSINIDKTGNAQVDTQEQDSKSGGQDTEHQEAEKSKQFADAIRSAVQKEITKQQRPGGLLRDGATYAAGRRV